MANNVQPITVAEQKFIWAERQQESGGNYGAVNPGSGALGAYQIMPANLSGWERQAGAPQESGTAFLNDHTAQDLVALKILGGYYQQYGDAGAAAMWYSGQPDPNKSYGNPPVSTYVSQVLALEKQAPDTGLPGGVGVAGGSTGGTVGSAGTTAQPASITSGLIGTMLSAMGINGPDFLERAGLILLGGILLVVGLIKFSGADDKAKAGAKAALAFETRGAVG